MHPFFMKISFSYPNSQYDFLNRNYRATLENAVKL